MLKVFLKYLQQFAAVNTKIPNLTAQKLRDI
jgi:hypothetical protein